jgi:hypothetical protein
MFPPSSPSSSSSASNFFPKREVEAKGMEEK